MRGAKYTGDPTGGTVTFEVGDKNKITDQEKMQLQIESLYNNHIKIIAALDSIKDIVNMISYTVTNSKPPETYTTGSKHPDGITTRYLEPTIAENLEKIK